jgi:hypothetical protein
MREIYKDPMLYYVLAPMLVLAWPLLVWGLYLPRAQTDWDKDQGFYEEATSHILEILEKDPERLKVSKVTQSMGKFTYADAVDRAGNLCRIPSGKVDLSTGNIVTSGKKEVQHASVSLTDVGIVQAAKFLSTIQAMWVNLTCERVKLSKKDGMPDQWDMDLRFRYNY